MSTRCRLLASTGFLAVGLMGLLWLIPLMGQGEVMARGGAAILRVATTGTDAPGCGGAANPCRTLQYAINAAYPGDEIRLAAGTYTGVQALSQFANAMFTPTQHALIYKDLTVRGGYVPPDWNTYRGLQNPTILDAQSQGRVLVVTATNQVRIEGLAITRGRARFLGGYVSGDAGGGIYVYSATVTVSDCHVYANQAVSDTQNLRSGYGGGLFVFRCMGSAVANCVIEDNVASWRWHGFGGGLYSYGSPGLEVTGNRFSGNQTTAQGNGHGGGLALYTCRAAEVKANVFDANSGGRSADAEGGAAVIRNCLYGVFSDNVVTNNSSGGGLSVGGGLLLGSSQYATVSGNRFEGNTANRYSGKGGGIYVDGSRDLTLTGNVIRGNKGSSSETHNSWGGGVYLSETGPHTITNNALVDNQVTADGGGAGLYVDGGRVLLLHNTVSANTGGDGSGICISGTLAALTGTNNLVASQTVGVSVPLASAVNLDHTLWWSNDTDRKGTMTHTADLSGDPKLANDGYHIRWGSAAQKAGVDVGVTRDIDGHTRPQLGGFDVGCDQMVVRVHLPVVARQ